MFINFEGIKNARELGGIKTKNGQKIKSGVLLRTGNLMNATQSDIQRLKEMGVEAVVDFRYSHEALRDANKYIPGSEYLRFPVLPPRPGSTSPGGFEQLIRQNPHEVYKMSYTALAESEASERAYRAFFMTLLAHKGAPVLWHCTQGKDRTGIAAILLLTALGVPFESALKDYFDTNTFMEPELNELKGTLSDDDYQLMEIVMLVTQENLDAYLNAIYAKHGSIDNYLTTALKITPEEIETLKTYYLE